MSGLNEEDDDDEEEDDDDDVSKEQSATQHCAPTPGRTVERAMGETEAEKSSLQKIETVLTTRHNFKAFDISPRSETLLEAEVIQQRFS